MIQIDYREESLKKYWPDAEFVNLPVGDILEDGFCIERKGSGKRGQGHEDFLNSILNHHIFNQAINMQANYPNKCVIIVESNLKKISDGIFYGQIPITIENVRGAVAALYRKYRVPVLFVDSKDGFVKMTNLLLEHNRRCIENNEDVGFVYDTPVCKEKANHKLQVLLQMPNIGLKKAEEILEYYGTFDQINKKERLKGISQETLDNILEILK